MLVLGLLRHAAAASARCTASSTTKIGGGLALQRVGLLTTAKTQLGALRLASSSAKTKPLGLKEGVPAKGTAPSMQLLIAYVAGAMTVMAVIARYKSRDEVEDERSRIFNMAKRAVVKDRRVFETVGYPKEFERLQEEGADGETAASEANTSEGRFRIKGDNGTVVVHYRQNLHVADAEQDEKKQSTSNSDIVTFDVLEVEREDGSQFSALESFLRNEEVVQHQQSQSLGKKLFMPVLGGVVIGGLASFLVIRILRNRPFYVHKLVLDHVNNHDLARQLLGHPIKSDRTKYVGLLTNETANYTIACEGPRGKGTLIVKAFKKEKPATGDADADADADADKDKEAEPVMATPGTSWKFSTLVLSVARSEKRKAKAKNAKTINLLSGGDVPPLPTQRP